MLFLLFSSLFAAEIFRFGPDNTMLFVEASILQTESTFLFQIDPGLSYSMLTENVVSSRQIPTQLFRGNSIAKSELLLDNQKLAGTFYVIEGSQNFPLWGGVIGGDLLKDFIVDIQLTHNSISLKNESSLPLETSFLNSQDGLITSVKITPKDPKQPMVMKELLLLFRSSTHAAVKDGENTGSSFIGNFQLPKPVQSSSKNTIGLNELEGTRLILDMKSKKMSITKQSAIFPKKRKAYTELLISQYKKLPLNDTSQKRFILALIYINEEKISLAINALTTYLKNVPEDVKALDILNTLQINTNTFSKEISDSDIPRFVASKNWIAIINHQILNGDPARALTYAQKGVEIAENQASSWIALSDAYLGNNDVQKARISLAKAKTINKTPNAYVTRSSLLAFLSNDHEAAISYLRQQIRQPTPQEIEIYVYTRMFSTGNYDSLFARDITNLPKGSSDFRILSLQKVHDTINQESMFTKLQTENCHQLFGSEKINCFAWLNSLNGTSNKKDVQMMKSIVRKHPFRSDFWDTLGNIYIEQNNPQKAKDAFYNAFIHDPDNPYMLFQYYWFSQL